MCGNGARCIAAYFLDSRRADTVVTFTALGDRYTAERIGRELTVHMKDPSGKLLGLTLDVDGKIIPCNYIDTGSPHAVVFVNEQFNPFDRQFNTANIVPLGRQLRYHETFKPFGTNVNFVSDYQPHEGRIKIRTYERGVEDETLSCGTGSIASAIITSDLYAIDPPIHVVTRSGATLIVDFQRKEEKISGVTLTGPISYHFTGTVYYNPDMHNAGIDVYYKDINNT
jgi:diaminopimelate epimerase